ncbi:MAG: PAS domain-containing sensor histidine kinase [Gammaproteobacteria bacterium]|nr:PAS domain-containing sensor histidine kinase [Gammaproteobacteria bacterium]
MEIAARKKVEQQDMGHYLLGHMPQAIATGVVILVVLHALLEGVVSPFYLSTWSLMLVAVLFTSAVIYVSRRNAVNEDGTFDDYWLRLLLMNTILFAVLCSTLLLTVFDAIDIYYRFLIILGACGMSALAMPALMLFRQVYLAFASIMLLPLIAFQFYMGTQTAQISAAVMLLFYLGLIVASRKLAESMHALLTLKHENIRLVQSLEQSNQKLEQSNDKLNQEIRHRLQVDTRLRQDTEQLARIVDAADDALLVVDASGRVVRVNQAMLHLCGHPAEELLGHHYLDNVPPNSDPQIAAMIHEALEGRVHEHGCGAWLMHRDGRMHDLRIAVHAIADRERVEMVVCTLTDISREKSEVRIKDEFISTVSHELRTPLTAIHGTLRLLDGGVAGKFTDDVHQMLRVAMNNSERLSLLVNDLLDVQKMEAGRMDYQYEEINACELVEEAVQAIQGYAHNYHVALQLVNCLDEVIRVDRRFYIQVLFNLLSNAIKYTPGGETVTVSMSRIGSKLRVCISDRGGGIPEVFRPYLFERFSRLHQLDQRQHRGTGLGLSIAKQMIESMGGNIAYDTKMGEGTRFFVDIGVSQTQLPEEDKKYNEQFG